MQNIGLYLHIPFCDGKCYYCNFYSKRPKSGELDEYVHHLKVAIRSWNKKLNRQLDTVYFGGGTPSVLGHERLSGIFNCVKESFPVAENAEITVEVNPSSAGTIDYFVLRNAGFNRLSIGLQSANDHELKLLGRRHTAEEAQNTVKEAQAAGFDNISLDVMLAIPEQTLDSLHRTLDFCTSCQVQHISAYILKIEPQTRFYRDREIIMSLFDEDAQAAIYEDAVRYLQTLGYKQYEISNFSLTGRESRHNLKYWHDEEYLGVGPSAHSYLDGRRFYYDNSMEAFYAGAVVDEGLGGYPEEYIMLALRLTEGLRFSAYEERFHERISESFLSAARRLEEHGLVRVDASSLSLTVKGFLVSNAVIGYLLQNT